MQCVCGVLTDIGIGQHMRSSLSYLVSMSPQHERGRQLHLQVISEPGFRIALQAPTNMRTLWAYG
jgi:hypothetical protein